MYYIVQENTFNEEGHRHLTNSLERFHLDYEIVKVLPFTDSISVEYRGSGNVFVFGGMKLARLAAGKWFPGSLMSEQHNFIHYRNLYHDNLLNYDSRIVQFQEDFPWNIGTYFIRPCNDLKGFDGGVYDIVQWSQFRHEALSTPENFSSQLLPHTLIQVASVKRTRKEFRIWIIDKKIVTASQYKQGCRCYTNGAVDQGALDFCNEMLELGSVAKAFVMDVALTDYGYKIVECGCINCAGFYNTDMQKLVAALEDCDWNKNSDI